MHRFALVGLTLVLLFNLSNRASAAAYFWLGGNGLFGDDAKWQDYGDPTHHESPGAADSAYIFSSDPAYSVFFDDDFAVNFGNVGGTAGSVYFGLMNGSYAVTDLRIGDYDGGGNPANADNTTLLAYGDPLTPHDNLLSTYLTVGGAGTGTFWLYSGAHLKSTRDANSYGVVNLGYAQNGVGTMIVADAGSLLDAAGNDILVGKAGHGTLNLYEGGQVKGVRELFIGTDNGNTHDNAVNVNDTGSLIEANAIYAGNLGKGTLRIHSGSKVQLTGGSLFIGQSNDAVGSAEVFNTGSLLDTGSQGIYVGSFGSGTFYVHDGAQATSNYVFIGAQTGSHGDAYVYDANSLMMVTNLYVGYEGSGSLFIHSGGKVQTGTTMYIGYLASGAGFMSVMGSGSTLDGLNHDIVVGDEGTGALHVSAGGRVITSGVLGVGGGANSHNNIVEVTGANSMASATHLSIGVGNSIGDSRVTVADSANVYVTNTITLGSRATLDTTTGSVDATNTGPQAAAGTLRVGFNGTLTGIGKVKGNVLSVEAGRIIPDSTLGTLTIDGNFTQTSGQLFFRIEGQAPNQYSHLDIAGTANFGGALNVSIASSYMPVVGDAFDFLSFASSSGTFGTLVLPTLTSGLMWSTSQLYSDGILRVVSSMAVTGDYNQNGTVDAADYTVWRNNLGSGTALPNDDTAGVGPDDYARWKINFGNHSGSGSAASGHVAVPEPASLVVLLMGTLAVHISNKRRRRHRTGLGFTKD